MSRRDRSSVRKDVRIETSSRYVNLCGAKERTARYSGFGKTIEELKTKPRGTKKAARP